ncbi:hypothetical protein F5Y17DRAFT_83420 [Xylariaceae sp. FL0594]|nr:hypothetical protein F5Y17DRAFT_83420 [Xylariaceae sp. FL0594]
MAEGAVIFTIFSLLSLSAPALGAAARFAAVDDAVLLPFGGGAGISPRWYAEGIPATPAQPLSRNLKHVLLNSDGEGQLEAQTAQCSAGQHSCFELGEAGVQKCCDNDRYCYLDNNSQPRCCSIGVKCADSPCAADQRFCYATETITLTTGITALPTGTASAGGQAPNLTSLVSFSTIAGCCNRQCGVSFFQCEPLFGTQCCPNGNKCGLGSQCIEDLPASTSTSISSIVSIIPPGCIAATQFLCPGGDGCCDTGSVCTFQSDATATSAAVCSPDPNFTDGGSSTGALSNGARIGIGVGVALGAAIVIAAITWFCIYRRKRAKAGSKSNASALEMHENDDAEPNGTGQPAAAVGGLAGRRSRAQRTRNSFMSASPPTPWTGRSVFSDASGPTISSARPLLHDHGRVYSYFGPTAVPGPFTEREGDDIEDARMAAAATTPPTGGPLSSDSTGQFATPMSMPYHPDHILRPVEIGDSNDGHQNGGGGMEKEKEGDIENGPVKVESPVQGHHDTHTTVIYELMGSLGTPSPLNPDGTTTTTGHPVDG